MCHFVTYPISCVILYHFSNYELKPSTFWGRYGYFFPKFQDGSHPTFWNCNDVSWDRQYWVFCNVVRGKNFIRTCYSVLKIIIKNDMKLPNLSNFCEFSGFDPINVVGHLAYPKMHILAWFRDCLRASLATGNPWQRAVYECVSMIRAVGCAVVIVRGKLLISSLDWCYLLPSVVTRIAE